MLKGRKHNPVFTSDQTAKIEQKIAVKRGFLSTLCPLCIVMGVIFSSINANAIIMGVSTKQPSVIALQSLVAYSLPANTALWPHTVMQSLKETEQDFIIPVICHQGQTHISLPKGVHFPIQIDQSKLSNPLCLSKGDVNENKAPQNKSVRWLLASSKESNVLPSLTKTTQAQCTIYVQKQVEMEDDSPLNLYWVKD